MSMTLNVTIVIKFGWTNQLRLQIQCQKRTYAFKHNERCQRRKKVLLSTDENVFQVNCIHYFTKKNYSHFKAFCFEIHLIS